MTTTNDDITSAITVSLLIGRHIVDFVDDLDVIAGNSKLKMTSLASALAIIIAEEGYDVEEDTEAVIELIPVLVDIVPATGDELEDVYSKASLAGVLN